MSKETIISKLLGKQLLTTKNIQTLQAQNSNKDFLTALLEVYENKVSGYFKSCELKMKKYLLTNNSCAREDLEAIATQKIIDYAYSAVLETDKASFLLSLTLLLKQVSPELAVCLGMSAVYKEQDTLKVVSSLRNQVLKNFISYVARYLLFRDVGQDLIELCVAVHQESPHIFPLYLLQSFVVQSQIKIFLEDAVAAHAQPVTTIFTESVKQTPDIYKQCLSSLMYYVASLLKTTDIDAAQKKEFFSHLDNDEKTFKFIADICIGYLVKMSNGEQQVQIFAANAVIFKSEINAICLPALNLLGFSTSEAVLDLSAYKNNLTQALVTIEANKTNINEAANGLRDRAHQEINSAVANFKPVWNVGFGTGVGMPSPSFRI